MTRLAYAPVAIKSQATTYYGFRGIDRSRDIAAMETQEQQNFWQLDNCYVDYRGQLIRDPKFFLHSGSNRFPVKAIRFYSRDGVVFAEEDATATHLSSDTGKRIDDAYNKDAVVSMTNFQGKVHVFSEDVRMYRYSGGEWSTSTSTVKPSFGVPIQRRLAVAGFRLKPTEIQFSRVDNPNIFLDEEAPTEEVTRAAFIDISNLIGTADEITGLGTFEANRLAVFTKDQTLVYIIDPDFEQWQLDSRANLRIGCISHNSIVNAGSDLLFCSRRGIHSIMRSEQNGITIAEASLSDEIEPLYQELVKTTPNPKSISAVYDQDTQTYHVFFPRPGGQRSVRLSMNFRAGYEMVNFQLGDTLLPRCGTFLGGRLMFGTADGVYESTDRTFTQETGFADLRRSPMRAETPVLWLGDFISTKRTHTLLLQASGQGRFFIEALDDADRLMASIEVNLDRLDKDKHWGDAPLRNDYSFPFNHVFRGVRLRFRTEDLDTDSEVTIISFAFLIHKEK
ncbi:MAG: hypothetical protein CL959_04155 [Euryarchaeota archaeon]|nr:hypothetical protein [Euryarchaeota archaeon]